MPNTIPPLAPPPPGVSLGPVTSAGDRLYQRLAPVATYDPENGNVVAAIAQTLARHQQLVEDVTRDGATREAWAVAGDPDTAPAQILPWLAQLPGAKLLPSDTEDQQRARIKAAAGFYRGTDRALIEELQLHLTGTKTVYFLRWDPDLWHPTVGTLATETPADAPLDAAAASQKPAGAILARAELDPDTSLLEWMADVIAHREIIDGIDTYVADPTDTLLADWLADNTTLTAWFAGG